MCQIKFNFWLISALSSPLQYRLRAGEGRRRCGNKVDSENLKYSRLSDILSDNSNCQTPLSQQPWAEPARDSKSTIICCWFFFYKKSIYRSALWKKIMASEVACEEKSLIGTKSRSLKYLFDPRRREGGPAAEIFLFQLFCRDIQTMGLYCCSWADNHPLPPRSHRPKITEAGEER